jgi:hypothetical protein
MKQNPLPYHLILRYSWDSLGPSILGTLIVRSSLAIVSSMNSSDFFHDLAKESALWIQILVSIGFLLGQAAIFVFRRQELYYYQNFGLSPVRLLILAWVPYLLIGTPLAFFLPWVVEYLAGLWN